MKRAGWILLCILNLSLGAWAQTPSFVTVPGGKLTPFWLKPQKGAVQYSVPEMKVQVHQTTNEEFIEFLKRNPQWQKPKVSPLMAEEGYLDQFENDLNLKPGANPKAPVTSVSWFAARAYCQSLGARLPKISEWEYFAAASEKKADANKDPAFLERILTWYGQPKPDVLPSVGSIYKNLYGVDDPHGLVWEWVEDFNSNTFTGESREDTSLDRNLFCGAGSINAGDKENYAAFMRFAFRGSLKGTSALWNLGFRCVKGSKP